MKEPHEDFGKMPEWIEQAAQDQIMMERKAKAADFIAAHPEIYGITFADCDCCGEYRPVSECHVVGMETWACDECRSAG